MVRTTGKIGPKEALLRAQREAACKIKHDDPACLIPKVTCRTCNPQLSRRGPPTETKLQNDGVALAPPVSVQKPLAKKLASHHKELAKTAPATPAAKGQESKMRKTKTTKKAAAKKAANGKARAPVKAAKGASKSAVRPGTKVALVAGMLQRPEGCTTKDVLKATGWPAVSMPQQAKAAGLTLKKDKKDGVTVYSAA